MFIPRRMGEREKDKIRMREDCGSPSPERESGDDSIGEVESLADSSVLLEVEQADEAKCGKRAVGVLSRTRVGADVLAQRRIQGVRIGR